MPTAASLAAVMSAAQEAKQKALQKDIPVLPPSASLATSSKPEAEEQPLPAALAGPATSNPTGPAGIAFDASTSAAPTEATAQPALTPMDVDSAPTDYASASEAQREPSKPGSAAADQAELVNGEKEEGHEAEVSRQTSVQLPVSELERSVA